MNKTRTTYTAIALFLALAVPAAAQDNHDHGNAQGAPTGPAEGGAPPEMMGDQGQMMQNMMHMMKQMHQKMMGQGGMQGMTMGHSQNSDPRGQMGGMGMGPIGGRGTDRMGMMDGDMMDLMSRRHAGSASPSGDISEKMSMHMKQFDANGDGTLSLAEFETLHSALVHESMVDRFQHLDADGDGKVDSIDDLIEKARLELDADKQSAIWQEAQIQLLNHAAVVPIIRLKYVFPMKSYVDIGHPLDFSWSTYSPQITEKTRILEH